MKYSSDFVGKTFSIHVAYWFAWAGYFENASLGGQSP
jgi:hypothetical protein